MDVTTDSSATVTAIDGPVGTALAPRRRRATRPTGPPTDAPDIADIVDGETGGGTTTSTIAPASDDTEDSADTIVRPQTAAQPRRPRALPMPRLGRPRWGHDGLRVLAGLLAVVALAAAATVAGLALSDHRHTTAQEQDRAAIVDVARRAVTSLINIDRGSAAKDFAQLGGITTAPFADQLHSQSGDYLKTVQDADVQSSGQVVAAGITADGTASDGTTTVIVAADAKVTNTQTRQQEQRSYRFTVKVKPVDGAPKVSDVEFVP